MTVVGLIVATFAAYYPVLKNGFVRLDDGLYLILNPTVQSGITVDGVIWAFTNMQAGTWHPVTWISHMVDVQLFTMDRPGLHHAMSLAIHCANAALVLIVLMRLTGRWWCSAMVAALFALHPLRVESVAWAAERKDVLSTFFGLLAIWAYARYTARISVGRYVLVAVFMTLSLMSKPMLVTLPFLLLLLDIWPLRRWRLWTTIGESMSSVEVTADQSKTRAGFIVGEKLPLIALSALFCVIAFITQQMQGAMDYIHVAAGARLANAAVAYVRYLGMTIWPTDLSYFYPYPSPWSAWSVMSSLVVLAALMICAWSLRRNHPYLLVGWLWFLGTLVPVIGLVQVGAQSIADRYLYFPQVGILIGVVWGISSFVNRAGAAAWARWAAPAVSVTVLLILGVLSNRQARVWRDAESLYQHAITISSDNYAALNGLGILRRDDRKFDQAAEFFRRAAAAAPHRPELHANLAESLLAVEDIDGAMAAYESALKADPSDVNTCNNLAWLLAAHWDPASRDGSRAVDLARRACEATKFNDPSQLDTLAAAHAEHGNFAEAIEAARSAHELAVQTNQSTLAKIIEGHLELLEKSRPIRIPPPRQ